MLLLSSSLACCRRRRWGLLQEHKLYTRPPRTPRVAMMAVKDSQEQSVRLEGLKFAYIGDGNNMAHSIMVGCAKMGMHVAVGHPKGYAPDVETTTRTREIAAISGSAVQVTEDPMEAAAEADVIYTDVWASMGQEDEAAERLKRFEGFQVNERMMKVAKPSAIFLHCLPAHRGEEVSAAVSISHEGC